MIQDEEEEYDPLAPIQEDNTYMSKAVVEEERGQDNKQPEEQE